MAREQGRERSRDPSPLSRRTCLKVVGTLLGSMAASTTATETVSATTLGYGEGGYGEGEYGGKATDPTLTLAGLSDITESSATFTGDVTSLGTASSVTAAFQYRQQGTTSWTTTAQTSLSAPSTYTVTETGFSPNTTYEVRGIATGSGTTVTTAATTMTTAARNTSPTITRFEIATSSQLGDTRMFTVKWAAEDVNHDLDTVEVVVAESPLSFNFAVTDVSGTTASGWDMFEFPVGVGLDVTLRVSDGQGNTVRETQAVTL